MNSNKQYKPIKAAVSQGYLTKVGRYFDGLKRETLAPTWWVESRLTVVGGAK